MQDKPLTIIIYAVGASLAAISFTYIFGPTVFASHGQHEDSGFRTESFNSGIVVLSNPANDCFINSVLQALAGLSSLRNFIERELHRRNHSHYEEGTITVALRDILDKLNEQALIRRTHSAQVFVTHLECALGAHISRHQQDAQEFLQAIIERLNDEFTDASKAQHLLSREHQELMIQDYKESTEPFPNRNVKLQGVTLPATDTSQKFSGIRTLNFVQSTLKGDHAREVFPFQGEMESYIECLTCHFRPTPTISTFEILTLSVPLKSSTTLNDCFDNLTKVEYIDDFRCGMCRLNHALAIKERTLLTTQDSDSKASLNADIAILRQALDGDPNEVSDNAHLPPIANSPKRRIARHTRISKFPNTLAIHLSRSIFNLALSTTKNTAQVSFPIVLPLGGLLSRRNYTLRAMITHKGGHNSGHYESFRPHSTSTNYPKAPLKTNLTTANQSKLPEIGSYLAPRYGLGLRKIPRYMVPQRSAFVSDAVHEVSSGKETSASTENLSESSLNLPSPQTRTSPSLLSSKGRSSAGRWWRISDEKAWEVQMSDVLAMQKEVYILFYEISD